MLRNQAHALLQHGHIETTVPKAKELRPFVERLITIAKRAIADGSAPKALTARREVAPRHPGPRRRRRSCSPRSRRASRRGPGGYTRLLRIGYRQGDAAEMALRRAASGFEFDPKAKAAKDAKEGAASRRQGRRRTPQGRRRPAARQADGRGGRGRGCGRRNQEPGARRRPQGLRRVAAGAAGQVGQWPVASDQWPVDQKGRGEIPGGPCRLRYIQPTVGQPSIPSPFPALYYRAAPERSRGCCASRRAAAD